MNEDERNLLVLLAAQLKSASWPNEGVCSNVFQERQRIIDGLAARIRHVVEGVTASIPVAIIDKQGNQIRVRYAGLTADFWVPEQDIIYARKP